jgi:hypothetical protein
VARSLTFGVFLLASIACVAREVGDQPVDLSDGSTSGAAATTHDAEVTSSPGVSPASSSDDSAGSSSPEPDPSSTTAVGGDCHEGSYPVGLLYGAHWWRDWTVKPGRNRAACTVQTYDASALQMSCVPEDATEAVDVAIWGDGPIVEDSLAAMVGLDGLQFEMQIVSGFFPGAMWLTDLTLRTEEGELLLLYSEHDYNEPGDTVAQDDPGWSDPFDDLALVDHDCERTMPGDWVPPGPGTAIDLQQIFALEVVGDGGDVFPLFQGQQATVARDGQPYEVSVARAARYQHSCIKCPDSQVWFSIVRHD